MNNDESRTYIQLSLIYRFRELWRQYILWTREYVTNVVCGFENSPLITTRMTQNAQDFGYEFRRYYGYENARIFELLLNKQFLLSAQLVNSVKEGDADLTDIIRMEWVNNTDDISGFLAEINSSWSKESWQQLIYDHLFMLEFDGTCQFITQYNADLVNYQVIEDQSLVLANYMADGIIKQLNI